MAFRLIRAGKALASFNLVPSMSTRVSVNGVSQGGNNYLKYQSPLTNIYRHSSFFNRYPAERLWAGATSVSNAGRKRGRGKSRRPIKNLNRGQYIGVGKINVAFPGLNRNIPIGDNNVRPERLPDDPDREKKLNELRDSMTTKRKVKLSPLERGWTGGKPGGRSVGPPDPVGEDTFEGFDSKILEYKVVSTMTGNLGRKRRVSALVMTGNGNGLAGFAIGKGTEPRPALKSAKNRAAMKLIYFKRYKEHTVYHDFVCQFGKTKIYVYKKGMGFGLRCHRVLKTCCELMGIKDLRAKIEGPCNVQHMIKAFLIGLLQQKTHEELAEEKKLHLVEFCEEMGNYPTVVASPSVVRKAEEIPSDEILDFTQYVLGGKVIYNKPKPPIFYTKLPSWTIRLRKTAYLRNKEDVRLRMLAEHGDFISFYTDKYPEARARRFKKTKETPVESEE